MQISARGEIGTADHLLAEKRFDSVSRSSVLGVAKMGASVIGGVPAQVRFCALVHGEGDADYARALADRIGDAAQCLLISVGPGTAPVSLGPSVASVLIWSHAAARAHVGGEMAAYVAHDRAAVVVVRDEARLPAGFAGLAAIGAGDGDAIVDGALLRDALTALKAMAAPVDFSTGDAPAAHSRGAFLSGIAASVAVFGVASVGGYVFLPAVAAQDSAPLGPVPAVAPATAENAFAVAPAVAVVYADAASTEAESYVSARFGADLRVAFSAMPNRFAQADAGQPQAADLVGVQLAQAKAPTPAIGLVLTPIDAAEDAMGPIDGAPVDGSPIDSLQIAALDQPQPFGPIMLVNADFGDVPPLFIIDMPSEEPAER
jgi:hypothetical protein